APRPGARPAAASCSGWPRQLVGVTDWSKSRTTTRAPPEWWENRNQVLDRNWKVCTQTPRGGTTTGTDTKIDFGTVKNEETCP
ncbi:hypothetical protein ACFVZ8_33240, partial [Streptomyces sp. NPDC059558]